MNSNHSDNERSFCRKDAWHTGEHLFDCIHESFNKLDIVFCCDTTGSMSTYINESKETIRRIIETSNMIKDVKFRFVAYRDHPPEDYTYITKSNPENLTSAANITGFIETLDAAGGGDEPEVRCIIYLILNLSLFQAVLDGLYDAVINTNWRDVGTLKYIIHIADSPPHGRIYSGDTGDHWPEGCPCGRTIETISSRLNKKNIRYKLMKIGSSPNTMSVTFRNFITYFEESDLDGAFDLSTKFIGILSRDLQAEEVDVIVN